MNYTNLLFAIRATEVVNICSSPADALVHPNIEEPAATGSSRRPASTTRGPKISALYYLMEAVLTRSEVAALTTADGSVYCEVKSASLGKSIPYLWHEGVLYEGAGGSTSELRTSLLLCTLLSGIIKRPSDYAETATYLEAAVKEYKDKKYISKALMASLCDCFYYDLKHDKGTAMDTDIPTNFFSDTQHTLVQQSIRVSSMTLPATQLAFSAVNEFPSCLSKTFAEVTLSEASAAATSTSTSPLSSLLNDCKKGGYEIGYEWSTEQIGKTLKPSYLDTFIPNESFETLVKLADYDLNEVLDRLNAAGEEMDKRVAIADNYINVILAGRPATGKTVTAMALSAALGMPIYTVSNTKGTEEDTFEGMNKVVENKFSFMCTPFLEGYENGGIIVLEEFNLADPAVMQGALGQAIEYPFVLMKDGYAPVHRHPMCIIISTMNPLTQGSREPNEAFTSRSSIVLQMDDPSDAEFLSILEKKGYKRRDCATVYKAYQAILKYLTDVAGSEELALQVTLRHCLKALHLMKIGSPVKKAIQNTMVGSIAIKDPLMAKEVMDTVISPLRL